MKFFATYEETYEWWDGVEHEMVPETKVQTMDIEADSLASAQSIAERTIGRLSGYVGDREYKYRLLDVFSAPVGEST